MGAGAFCMDDALGDAFAVKVGELVDQGKVLEDDGAGGTGSLAVLVVVYRAAVGRGNHAFRCFCICLEHTLKCGIVTGGKHPSDIKLSILHR